jgi:hypothetical protein
MARLITTAKEKATNSFLDWDNEAIGLMCKSVALDILKAREKIKKAKPEDDEDDLGSLIHGAEGMLLVSSCILNGADELTLKFGGFESAGVPQGDWEIVVRKIK